MNPALFLFPSPADYRKDGTVFLKIYIITTFDKRGLYHERDWQVKKIKPPLRAARIITNTAISGPLLFWPI
jgi:hypothetical protein